MAITMRKQKLTDVRSGGRCSGLLLVAAAVIVTACTTPRSAKRTQVTIEVQEEVGFTITEEARISGKAREGYQAALGYFAQGRHAEGIEVLERVIAESPELSAPRIDLAIAYHATGDLESAEKHLRAALDVNPEHPVALNEIGIVYRKTGRFVEARASYEAALAVYPGFHHARRNLAVLCDLYLGDLECALENYEAYMETVAEDPEAAIWIADIRNRVGG